MATSKRSTATVEETIDTTVEVEFVDVPATEETIVIENTPENTFAIATEAEPTVVTKADPGHHSRDFRSTL